MGKIGSAQSDSCPRMIRKLGCIPRKLLATWSAMQICPTRALWCFSAIPDASAYELLFSFSTPEEGPVPRSGPLTCIPGRRLRNVFYTNPPLCINKQQLREGFAIIDRVLEIMDKAVES